jgi:hypothetical protein
MNIPTLLIGMIIGSLITAAGFIYYFIIKVAKEAKQKDQYTPPSNK